MRDSLVINQKLAIDFDLNLTQASIYHTILDLQEILESVASIGDQHYYYITYRQISDELPLMGLGDDSIYRSIKQLENADLVERANLSDEQVYVMLSGEIESGCRFCGYNRFTLHDHHYPVRKTDDGTETIRLCPNCHTAFHAVADHGLIRAVRHEY